MPIPPERGVHLEEHRGPSRQGAIDWDSARIFLEVVRQGSFRAASTKLGRSVNALRRRVDDLQHRLGATLLTRHVDGVRLTAEGQQALKAVERMEIAACDIVRAQAHPEGAISGEVRLAVTEGLGTFWLAPRLVEFQRAFPRVLVDMNCTMHSVDVLRLEADAAVQITRPISADLKLVKLGRLHVMPFAAQSYLDAHGIPGSLAEIREHRIVLQIAEQVAGTADYDKVFPGLPQVGFVALRTNVSSAHYWSVAKGAGIGFLPTYAYAIGAPIVPIDIDMVLSVDIWLTYHPDTARVARVRHLLDWLVDAFDPRKFPWFRDEFVHPKDLSRMYRGEPLVNLFVGFAAAKPSTNGGK